MASPVWQFVAQRFAVFLHDLEPCSASLTAVAAARRDVDGLLSWWLKAQPAGGYRATARRRLPSTELVGGYANGTALASRPTVDLVLAFAEDARPRASARLAESSLPYSVSRLTELLCQRYGAVESDPQGWITIRTDRRPAVALPVPVHIRLLPAFRGPGGVLVALQARRASSALWWHVHADAHRHRLDYADLVSGGKARHLVRLVKAWRSTVDAPLSGFAIELLVCEFLSVWIYRRRSLLFYDWMVRDFFFWLAAQAGRSLPVPETLEALPIGDRWLAAAERAHATARTAADLERENDSIAALGCWREIFGLDFCSGLRGAATVSGRSVVRRKA